MPTYYVKPGAHIKGDVESVASELTTLGGGAAGVTPDRVVLAACNPTRFPSLHQQFEWDDATAAHQHRLEQARYLLRSIEVVYEENPEAAPMRAFVSVATADEPRYVPTRDALADPDMRAQVLWRARVELDSFRRRYSHLRELADVMQAIERIHEEAAA